MGIGLSSTLCDRVNISTMLNFRIDRLFPVRGELVEPCKIPFDRLRANGNQTNLTLLRYIGLDIHPEERQPFGQIFNT